MAFEYLYKEYLNAILLSTLGTTYAKADLSNVITKSLGLNGYYKFPDGLVIQWGTNYSSGQYRTIYFPIYFLFHIYSFKFISIYLWQSIL